MVQTPSGCLWWGGHQSYTWGRGRTWLGIPAKRLASISLVIRSLTQRVGGLGSRSPSAQVSLKPLLKRRFSWVLASAHSASNDYNLKKAPGPGTSCKVPFFSGQDHRVNIPIYFLSLWPYISSSIDCPVVQHQQKGWRVLLSLPSSWSDSSRTFLGSRFNTPSPRSLANQSFCGDKYCIQLQSSPSFINAGLKHLCYRKIHNAG